METVPEYWGRTLRNRRRQLGMSQAEIARLSGKAQSQIARLESGNEDPRLTSLVQVLRSMGAEPVAVPVRLLPAVHNLIAEHSGLKSTPQKSRLVGNDPEDQEDDGDD
ncbi:MAG: helix-turn-helix domain-containing protein [Acidobacteria bacterium]|nr:helix-turn-helix domain-containing protein [Acidobacteriota bacterium]